MLYRWFATPWFLALLGFLPLLVGLVIFAAYQRWQTLARLGNLPTLENLIPIPGRLWTILRMSCEIFGLTMLIVGIAGPQWGRDWDQTIAPGRDVAVVLDISRSMWAEQPSRLDRAKAALIDLSRAMEERGGHRMALVAFAGRAKVLCPLTHDYDHFRDMLNELETCYIPPGLATEEGSASGTRMGEGLHLALTLLGQSASSDQEGAQGNQDVLLVSDGDDPAQDEDWRVIANRAGNAGIAIHTIGIGDPTTENSIPLANGKLLEYEGKVVKTRLQEQPLHQIAERTQGSYIPAHTKSLPLGKLFRERIEARGSYNTSAETLPLYRQRYPWFYGAALMFLFVEMVLGRWRSSKGSDEMPQLRPVMFRMASRTAARVQAVSSSSFPSRGKSHDK